MIFRIIFSLIFSSNIFFAAQAQITFPVREASGLNPSDIQWKKSSNDVVDLIFPKGMEGQSNRILNIINQLHQHSRSSIGLQHRHFDLLLQHRTVVPNGYVGLAPFRSEYFMTPPDNNLLLGSLQWADLLTVHEFRHVRQLSNGREGVTRILSYLFGQNGWSIGLALSTPSWFLEGDAVVYETALTKAGRGRTPSFLKDIKALSYGNRNYPYVKWRNGSFKDFVPDHYRLGYMMLTHVRNTYGHETNEKLLYGASSYRGIFYPLAFTSKRLTGKRIRPLFNEAWKKVDSEWDKATIDLVPSKQITTPTRTTTNYTFPQYDATGAIYALKSSFQNTDEIVKIKNGKEEHVTWIGLNFGDHFYMDNDALAWTEYSQHPRRTNQNYSDLFTFDLKSGIKSKLTQNGRFFNPALHPTQPVLAAVEVDFSQGCTIVLMDSKSGKVKNSLPLDPTLFATRMAWSPDGNFLVFIGKNYSGLAIYKLDIVNNTIEKLTEYTHHVLESPRVHGNYVYYSASYDGMDQVYRTSLSNGGSPELMANSPVGAYHPDINKDGSLLVFSDFTAVGHMIKEVALPAASQPISYVEPSELDYWVNSSAIYEDQQPLDHVSDEVHPSEDHNGLFRDMRLHSWLAFPGIGINVFNLQFNNVLDDVSIGMGAGFSAIDTTSFYNFNVSYARYFPIWNLKAELSQANGLKQTDGLYRDISFNQRELGGSMTIPLSWVRGNYFTNIRANIGLSHFHAYDRVTDFGSIKFVDFSDIASRSTLTFSHERRKAYQNLLPKLGVRLSLATDQYVDSNNARYFASSNFFLPGLHPNHGIKLSAAYQYEPLDNDLQIVDAFEYPRGYFDITNDEVWKVGAEYQMPLLYPDIGVNGLFFLKRIRTNLYYDFGKYKFYRDNISEQMQAVGAELIFDTNIFNILDVPLGYRLSYLLDDARGPNRVGWTWQFLIINEF